MTAPAVMSARWERWALDGGEVRCGDREIVALGDGSQAAVAVYTRICRRPLLMVPVLAVRDHGDKERRLIADREEGGLVIAGRALGCGVVLVPSPYRVVLSRREWQVMELLATGYTNKSIAAMLKVASGREMSLKTVDTHRGHILKKLGIRTNVDLARWAIEHGFVPRLLGVPAE